MIFQAFMFAWLSVQTRLSQRFHRDKYALDARDAPPELESRNLKKSG